jgi:hypothetical protein
MTIKPISECPNPLSGIYNPPDELKYSEGYRIVPPLPVIPDGYTQTFLTLTDGDGVTGAWSQGLRLTAEIEAEQKAEYIAKCQPYFGAMTMYRIALRRNFGDGAETNREVSQESAMAYFGMKVAQGIITPQETADSALMMALFPSLSALSPTSTTWDLPWEVLP